MRRGRLGSGCIERIRIQPVKIPIRFKILPGISRFGILRNPSANPKRAEEVGTLRPFLQRLEQFITLDDVEYGQDPPDFVFLYGANRIGVELTDLVPKPFDEGGYRRKADFNPWKKAIKMNPLPRHEFEWGEFTLKESLAAFESQFTSKCEKVKKWTENLSENWLLMHVGSGSPFGGLVASKSRATPGREAEVADYFAKTIHSVFSICQKPNPFHYVILYSGTQLLAVRANESNHYKFPTPDADILARGAAASDRFLAWRSTPRSIVEQPMLSSDGELDIR